MKKKRSFLILEILVAFTLILLCLPPLISSQRQIYQEKERFLRELQLDRWVAENFLILKENLYEQSIAIEDIKKEHLEEIEDPVLAHWGFQNGSYRIRRILPQKSKEEEDDSSVFRLEITYSFEREQDQKTFNFQYLLAAQVKKRGDQNEKK